MIFSAVILPGIRKIFNMVREKHNIAVARCVGGNGLNEVREYKEPKRLVGRTALHPLACPFNLCVERLSPLAGRSPMNGVGADIIKVFGIAFFQKGEVLKGER